MEGVEDVHGEGQVRTFGVFRFWEHFPVAWVLNSVEAVSTIEFLCLETELLDTRSYNFMSRTARLGSNF